MADEKHLTIRFGGKTYSTGDLLAADIIAMEEEWGHRFQLIDFDSMKASCWVAWLLGRRDDESLTLEDITSVTMTRLIDEADAATSEAPVPPTSGSRKRAGKSGRGGGQSTPSTSASGPGS